MSSTRITLGGSRSASLAALLALCAVLVSGQIAEASHAELECEHEGCSLCVSPANDVAMVCDNPIKTRPAFTRRAERLPLVARIASVPYRAAFIRAPPKHDLTTPN